MGLFCIGQDRLSFVLAAQLCDAGTPPLPRKEKNALFSLGSDLSDVVPYLSVVFPVLKIFLLSFLDQACAGIHPAPKELVARLQPPVTGAGGDQGFFFPLLVLLCCAVPAEPRGLLRKCSPEQRWHRTKVDGNRRSLLQTVIYNSKKQANNLFYFNFEGRGRTRDKHAM